MLKVSGFRSLRSSAKSKPKRGRHTLASIGAVIAPSEGTFMKYPINKKLLAQARDTLSQRANLYWIVGGAGAGKTTVCKIISERFGIPLYDMDAQIYGAYHGRFTPERHPVNYAWTSAPNGLEWLLHMSWDEFNSFNQATLPEYLDLLIEDVRSADQESPLLIDGGICNPGLLAQALPARQIVCLANPKLSSEDIWEGNEERQQMKTFVDQLPNPDQLWQTFLEFDRMITRTTLQECKISNIPVCTWSEKESPVELAVRVAEALGI
jgi:hypothetical protein